MLTFNWAVVMLEGGRIAVRHVDQVDGDPVVILYGTGLDWEAANDARDWEIARIEGGILTDAEEAAGNPFLPSVQLGPEVAHA